MALPETGGQHRKQTIPVCNTRPNHREVLGGVSETGEWGLGTNGPTV
jgi:hypothetical protein